MGRKEITTKEDLMKVIELFENTGITTGYPNKFTAPCLFPKFKNSEWLYLILFADDGSCHLENSDGRLLQNSRWLFPLSD